MADLTLALLAAAIEARRAETIGSARESAAARQRRPPITISMGSVPDHHPL